MDNCFLKPPFQSKALKLPFLPGGEECKIIPAINIHDLRLTPLDPIRDSNSCDKDLVYLTQKNVRGIMQSARFIYKDPGVSASTT